MRLSRAGDELIPDDVRIMQEEIFGPVLPIVTYRDLADAIGFVRGTAAACRFAVIRVQ
jgi:acyl-CoA reductase-like NAD-dependent aldehyde dehydrogenase